MKKINTAQLINAARYALENLDAAAENKLITAPASFQLQLTETRNMLRAALATGNKFTCVAECAADAIKLVRAVRECVPDAVVTYKTKNEGGQYVDVTIIGDMFLTHAIYCARGVIDGHMMVRTMQGVA